jgi:CrcB protein
MQIVLIAFFGLLGVFGRYGIDLFAAKNGIATHWGTFAINLSGSLLVTLIYVLGAEKGWIGTELRVALTVGLMGGFTTFSAYSLQSALLIESGAGLSSVLYMILSPTAGVLLAVIGLHFFRLVSST